jgi:hypothetical protein
MTSRELDVAPVTALKSTSVESSATTCSSCAQMQGRVRELLSEREALVKALAREKERANALFLAYPPQVAPQSSQPPMAPPRGEIPMRYRVVDSLNENFKRRLPALHQFTRRAISFVRAAALE